MKRLYSVLVLLLLILSACTDKCNATEGAGLSMSKEPNIPYISMGSLLGYKDGDKYIISVSDNSILKKEVEYSIDRKAHRVQNINLIPNYDIEQFINMDFDAATKRFGSPHADIGSGFYIPSYLTENAYIVGFQVEDGIVCGVSKWDVLTGKVVDKAVAQ